MSLNNLKDEEIEKILEIFENLANYDTIERENYDAMLKKKNNYVEIIPDKICTKNICQAKKEKKLNFLVGRRGSGKTTILERVKIECIESWFIKDELDFLEKEKIVLPVYLNAKNLFLNVIEKSPLTGDNLKDLNNFGNKLNLEILRQIEIIYDELRELGIIPDSIFLKIENLIRKKINKLDDLSFISPEDYESSEDFYLLLKECIEAVSYDLNNKKLLAEIDKNEIYSKKFGTLFNLNIYKELIKELKAIKEFPLNFIHFLLDDFSEISEINQKILLDGLIEPLFRSSSDLCFCIASYPHLFYTGSLKRYQDFQILNLDWYYLYLNEPHQKKIRKGIEITTQLLFRRLNTEFPDIFREKRNLAILFEDLETFLNHLFFISMNIPRLIGLILSYPRCVMSLKMKIKLSKGRIQEAADYIYKEILYKDYFTCLLNLNQSNYYFSAQNVRQDKILLDKLILNMKKKQERNGFFLFDKKKIQDKNPLLNRLETMELINKIDTINNNKVLYRLCYGCCIYNDIKCDLQYDINNLKENHAFYDISDILINLIEIQGIKREQLFNQQTVPQRFAKEIKDFDDISNQLSEDQFKLLHTLFIQKDKSKGWMAPDEIGIKKRLFPFVVPHMRVIRIIRTIKNLDKAKFLIDETTKEKPIYRLSNMGINFEDYCAWKLKL